MRHVHRLTDDAQKNAPCLAFAKHLPQVQATDGSQRGDAAVDDQLGIQLRIDIRRDDRGRDRIHGAPDGFQRRLIAANATDEEFSRTGHGEFAGAKHGRAPADYTPHRAFLAHNGGQRIGTDAVLQAQNQRIILQIGHQRPRAGGHIVCLGGDERHVIGAVELRDIGHGVQVHRVLPLHARDMQSATGGDVRNLLMLAHQRHVASSLLHQRRRNAADGARADHNDANGIHRSHSLPDGEIVSRREEKGKASPPSDRKKLSLRIDKMRDAGGIVSWSLHSFCVSPPL